MKTVGKWKLMDVEEFKKWLESQKVTRVITLIQSHHTAIPSYSHFKGDNHGTMLTNMETAHVKERKFAQIAQNFTIFPDGIIAICRDLNIAPAGIKGANATGICLEYVGNFDTGGDTMNPVQKEAILKVNAVLCQRFKITPARSTLVYHHWYDLNTGKRTDGAGATKTCPGTAFFGGNTVEAAVANFIPEVRKYIGEG